MITKERKANQYTVFFSHFKQMANLSKSFIDTYEYMDETNIEDELKCTICTQPFQKPGSLSCATYILSRMY
jgi:hypothetical protein